MGIKIIITGATGMVGEGVLLECLQNAEVSEILMLNRRSYSLSHSKLKELIVANFFQLDGFESQLSGYDACFFCAGVSSIGMKEAEYAHLTYELTLNVAHKLVSLNPGMTFIYVSGSHTDSTENGKMMWARVKGKTENALMRLPFRKVYNFRPGFMKPSPGQKNIKPVFRIVTGLYPVLKMIFPKRVSTMTQVGKAMINATIKGYPKNILEINDINAAAV